MNDWLLLLFASLVGSIFSLAGGFFLVSRNLSIERVQRTAIPFAVGALLAAAFLDLLPEALESNLELRVVMIYALVGFVSFFVLERTLGWFHHHHNHAGEKLARSNASARALIVTGDTLHNAIDGLIIGAAFLADPMVGVVTTLAIAAHEIPQEVGDFGVLLALGMSKRRVILVNIASAFVTVVAALLSYGLGSSLLGVGPYLLAIAAGMFIYIAASDLVPTIHEERSQRVANYQTAVMLGALLLVGLTTSLVHGFLEGDGHHGEHSEHIDHEH
ncbi:MAG TPA: ZIP family metal transporter [Candidatus Saccharimonadales bacterium]|jgi:zinc and cadmium transporter